MNVSLIKLPIRPYHSLKEQNSLPSAAPILIGQIAGIFTLGLSSACIGLIGVLGSIGIYIFVPETLIKKNESPVNSE